MFFKRIDREFAINAVIVVILLFRSIDFLDWMFPLGIDVHFRQSPRTNSWMRRNGCCAQWLNAFCSSNLVDFKYYFCRQTFSDTHVSPLSPSLFVFRLVRGVLAWIIIIISHSQGPPFSMIAFHTSLSKRNDDWFVFVFFFFSIELILNHFSSSLSFALNLFESISEKNKRSGT